ncbi:ketol-acid reductoisomerase [Gemmatimonas aurantiaca]|nr:ketol-acid reductoisomerase [Gemmatimonas aurantiaca]
MGTCAVLGYGSQGSAIAQNLRDSGIEVIIGLRPGSKSRRKAKADGFAVASNSTVAQAVRQSQTIIFAFPDHSHKKTFLSDIQPNLSNQTLIFLHGTSIHFKLITPPNKVDVIMLAPHGPGLAVREKFVSGVSGMSAFWAIHQDISKLARLRLFTFAKAIGISDKKKMFKTTFAEEAIGDLFGEQAVLCGGLTELIHAGFQTLTESGIKPDNAYLEVCYQLDLIVDLIKRFGIAGMYKRISVAAKYGALQTGPKLIDAGVKKRMKQALKKIESGAFARELSELSEKDITGLEKDLNRMTSNNFEKSAKKFSQ